MRIILTLFFIMLLGGSFASSTDKKEDEKLDNIQKFVEGAQVANSGFVNYYQIKERHYLEIPNRILGRDILTTITILKGAQQNDRNNGKRFGYGGDSMNSTMVRFKKEGDKVVLVQPDIHYTEAEDAAYGTYFSSLIDPIIQSFNLVACSDSSSLIDITDFYLADSELFSLAAAQQPLELGGYIPQESYSEKVNSFPTNINFRSVRCYSAGNPEKSTYTKLLWEVGSSWFLLPEKPMKIRMEDSRVGYFNTTLRGQVYGDTDNELFDIANRWRLEPRDEDIEKYVRGELVEPAKPIIFYIDRDMPPYVIDGIKAAVGSWQKVFEKVGFKNAIYARVEPTKEEDPDFSIEDARHSYISYKASPVPNAYGPMVVDPRSGEIICSHVAMFHSVMDLAQMWYFVQCGQADPEARSYPLKHEMISKLVNRILTHEIGHTLGLRHNFLGSTNFSTDSLRNNDFLIRNGLGTSIMDYERFNYVAQPEDRIESENLLPKIGVYDEFAIEWGYRYFPDTVSVTEESDRLKSWISEEQKKGGRHYVSESIRTDPRVQAEDCANDPVQASELGMKNLQYLMANLEDWTNEQTTEDYVLLRRRYLYILDQYEAYIGHVMQLIGGFYAEDCSCGETVRFNYKSVSAEKQERAMEFLNKYFLSEPEWLVNPSFIHKIEFDYGQRFAEPALNHIGQLAASNVDYSISSAIDPESPSYAQFLDYMVKALFPENKEKEVVSDYRRMLQSALLTQLTINLENTGNISYTILQELKLKMDAINAYAEKGALSADEKTRVHYQSAINFIKVWKTGKQNF
ncbi:zinc-dependent metalloprotease [Mangrovibacterium lignilyticum]|uniref:zinc-dependent metalloprotease n=1 Tax=Mangrovibacterium lignilyticum TaxID=2668052 RepID=UPI0013D18FAD|nr:zinc-dependent metalloprotease [Mangrovibacterium lignilyticum]